MRQRWSRSKRQKGWSPCWKLDPFQSWASFLPWLWKVLEILVPKLLNAETKEFHAWMFELLIFPHQPECMRLLAFGSLFIFCQALAVFSVHVFKSLAIIDKVQVPCPIHSGSPSRGVEVVDGINLFNNSSIAKKIVRHLIFPYLFFNPAWFSPVWQKNAPRQKYFVIRIVVVSENIEWRAI